MVHGREPKLSSTGEMKEGQQPRVSENLDTEPPDAIWTSVEACDLSSLFSVVRCPGFAAFGELAEIALPWGGGPP
jgi:hypothetical protein